MNHEPECFHYAAWDIPPEEGNCTCADIRKRRKPAPAPPASAIPKGWRDRGKLIAGQAALLRDCAKALEQYAIHLPHCATVRNSSPPIFDLTAECTCGLDALRAALLERLPKEEK